MNTQLNCVLLVDDDEPTNFLTELVIKTAACADQIVTVQSGQGALDYLISAENDTHAQPELIFLDINMPGMDGWEFMHEYRKLSNPHHEQVVVVMLTTSVNPDDEEKARGMDGISQFRHKPLTREMLDEIIREHFKDRLEQNAKPATD